MGLLECGHAESPHSEITRGYGKDDQGNRYCYDCCAARDRQAMRDDGRITLYLTGNDASGWYIVNWPASLKFKAYVKTGRHNIARVRYDAWFNFEGAQWHGVQYGDNTQIIHCNRTKG